MVEKRASSKTNPRVLLSVGLIALCTGVVGLLANRPVACGTPPSTELPKTQERKTTRIDWGIYQIYWGADRFERFLDIAIEQFASPPNYVMFYRDLACPFPARAVKIIRKRGAVPCVSLELWKWHKSSIKFLPQINDGAFDGFLESWARAAKAEGGPILLRFGFEFNGDWFSWSGDPSAYVEAWRRAHKIFKRIGADNVQWVWAPNITNVPDVAGNDMHLYYPGAKFVDWVGIDGYNWGDRHDQWHTWQSCQEIFAGILAEFDRRYPTHPVMLAEFGSGEDTPGRKAKWIIDALDWLSSDTRVSVVIWFNLDKRREGEHDWRINSSPESLKAFNKSFAGQ